MNLYKSLIFILYLGIFLGSGFRTPAQSRDSITLYGTLDTVQVIRQRIQHANEANAGARVTHISPAILQANKTRSLAELLTDHTSIYIKSLGTGALSTASFRGTSASQTRVNWNGINITPPLSGTFEFIHRHRLEPRRKWPGTGRVWIVQHIYRRWTGEYKR